MAFLDVIVSYHGFIFVFAQGYESSITVISHMCVCASAIAENAESSFVGEITSGD